MICRLWELLKCLHIFFFVPSPKFPNFSFAIIYNFKISLLLVRRAFSSLIRETHQMLSSTFSPSYYWTASIPFSYWLRVPCCFVIILIICSGDIIVPLWLSFSYEFYYNSYFSVVYGISVFHFISSCFPYNYS